MANMIEYDVAGAKRLLYSHVSASGYMTGKDNLASTDTGENSPEGRIKGVIGFDLQLPEPVRLPIPGDNGVINTFLFDSADPISFNFTVSVRAMLFEDKLSNVTHETLGEWEGLPFFASGLPNVPFMLHLITDAKSTEAGDGANIGYRNLVIPNCEIRSNIQPGTNKEFNEITYACVANETSIMPDGRTVVSVFPNAPNQKLIAIEYTSQYPLTYEAYVSDGADTTMEVTYAPISNAKSRMFIETTVFTVSAITTTDTVVPYTLDPTGTFPLINKFAIALYETTQDVV